jgi:hypothetical protein
MSQHLVSPLVQVMQQPSLVFSHLQCPQQSEMLQTWTPFQVQQQEQVPSQRAWQRFCKVAAATWSGQRQLILKPPLHFSKLSSHRGTTQTLPTGAPAGAEVGPGPVAKAPRVVRSVKTALDIKTLLFGVGQHLAATAAGHRRTRIVKPSYLWVSSQPAATDDCVPP